MRNLIFKFSNPQIFKLINHLKFAHLNLLVTQQINTVLTQFCKAGGQCAKRDLVI